MNTNTFSDPTKQKMADLMLHLDSVGAYRQPTDEEVRKQKRKDISVSLLEKIARSPNGETSGILANRLRSHPKDEVGAVLAAMEEKGVLRSEILTRGAGAGTSRRYFLAE